MNGRQRISATDSDGFGLAVVFTRTADRYAHAILAVTPERSWVMLHSSDSTDDENARWPDSPPLQQLAIEPRDAEHAALLMGMAGASTWSLAVESQSAERRLVFDAACNYREPPPALGSRYEVVAAPGASPSLWTPPPSPPQFGGHRGPKLLLRGSAAVGVVDSSDGLRWTVSPERLEPPPASGRWKYALELAVGD